MVIPTPYSQYLFHIGSISVRWYGFLIALAIGISYFLALREAKKEKVSEDKFDNIYLITVISGIIGARFAFILQNTGYYSQHVAEVVAFWDGGLSIHGAIIVGVIALLISIRQNRLRFFTFANILSPYLLLSGAIGRWGNYFNQEIVGKPADSFIKLAISPLHRPMGFEQSQYFHPVFLYESILLFAAFVAYNVLKNKLKDNALIYTLISYSLVRIIVEFWRIDYKPIFIRLDLAQWVSLGIIFFTFTIIFYSRKCFEKLKIENSLKVE